MVVPSHRPERGTASASAPVAFQPALDQGAVLQAVHHYLHHVESSNTHSEENRFQAVCIMSARAEQDSRSMNCAPISAQG